jgi:hypothetical protein
LAVLSVFDAGQDSKKVEPQDEPSKSPFIRAESILRVQADNIIPAISNTSAQAEESQVQNDFVPCAGGEVISISSGSRYSPQEGIRDAFENYQDYLVNGKYQLCFDISENELINFNETIIFSPEEGLQKEMIISGLKVGQVNPEQSLLEIDANEKVTIIDSTIAGGILLAGTAAHEIHNSELKGDGADETCLEIRAEGSVISNVDIHHCETGVNIQADHVSLQNNTRVFRNQVGVTINKNKFGTTIQESFIFANDDHSSHTLNRQDAVRFIGDNGVIDQARSGDTAELYSFLPDIAEEELLVTDPAAEIVLFDEVNPYFIPTIAEGVQNINVEFFLTKPSDCWPEGANDSPEEEELLAIDAVQQPCGTASLAGLTIPVDSLRANELFAFEVPEQDKEKPMLIMFSDDFGILGYSKSLHFTAETDGPVVMIGSGEGEAIDQLSVPGATGTNEASEQVTELDIPSETFASNEFAAGTDGVESLVDETSGEDGETTVSKEDTVALASDGSAGAGEFENSFTDVTSGAGILGSVGASAGCSLITGGQTNSNANLLLLAALFQLLLALRISKKSIVRKVD